MKKFLIAVAVLAVPGSAFAMDAKPASAAEGPALSLEYETVLKEDGTIIFEGDDAASGRRFRLKLLSDGFVSGKVGERQVRYAVEKSVRDRLVEKLRQRAIRGEATGGLGS
jgi:hypothetical protein